MYAVNIFFLLISKKHPRKILIPGCIPNNVDNTTGTIYEEYCKGKKRRKVILSPVLCIIN